MSNYFFKVLSRESESSAFYTVIGIILLFFLFISQQSSIAQTKIRSIPSAFIDNSDLTTDKQYKFEHYSTESGLSSDLVFKILKDKYGFLWFATQNGLNKFDTYNFITYENDPQDSNSISLNEIYSLCECDGSIWAGTWGAGLNKITGNNRFNHYYNKSQDITSISNNKIFFLFGDHNNILWICTMSGVDRYNPANNSFERVLSHQTVFSIAEDKLGNLFLAALDGLYVIENNRKTLHKYELPSKIFKNKTGTFRSITNVYIDHNNRVWAGTQSGLFQFDPGKGTFKTLRSMGYSFPKDINPKKDIDRAWISSIFEDSYGNTWVGSFGQGLFKIDEKQRNIIDFHNYIKDKYSINNYSIYDLNEDNSKLLWIATDHGLFKLNLRPPKFHIYSQVFKNKDGTGFAPAFSFWKESEAIKKDSNKYGNKYLWIGTLNGLNKINITNEENSYIQLPGYDNFYSNIVLTNIVKDEKDNLWFGTSNSGIHIYNPKSKKFVEGKGYYSFTNKIRNLIVYHILIDNENNIWLATRTGLYIFNKASHSWSAYNTNKDKNSLTENNLRTFYKDRDGILWIGTIDSGLNRFDYKKNQFLHFRYNINNTNSLSNDYVTCLCEDDLYIWAGTPNGLNRIDKKTLKCTRYYSENNFTSKYISGILPDRHENLWISTNRGISLLNTKDGSILNFDSYDGLDNGAFIRRAAYQSANGEIFFGNGQGFISFYPDSIQFNKYTPPIYLTKISVMGKEKNYATKLEDLKEITLNYNENFIQFEFAALDYTEPNKNRYEYKLDGLDKDWISSGNRRYASYTRLKTGTYYFRVIGSNADGTWNTNGLILKIVVVPPYWQTLWFRSVILVFVLFFAYVLYKIKVNSIQKRERQLENLNKQLLIENAERQKAELEMKKAKEIAENADRLKSEFLAQMSHEIRTPINAILSFSGLIREDVAEYLSSEMKEGFSIIDRASKRLIRTVDLILNMSLLQTDSFELNFQGVDLYEKILKKKIQEYSILAEEKGIEFKVIKETDNCTIYSDEAILDQIFDNLLNNAVKFTKQGVIGVHIFNDNSSTLTVEIYDTGIGISGEYVSNLFKPFSQEDGGYTRRFEGNGLGLALTKKYCDLTNIKIDVKSQKGSGTKVTLKF
jgi:signal transduction histidine kinase/ligand-binding sensor domain-containing protein